MVPPRSNGGSVEKEWQPMSALTCIGPISRASSFMDANSGRSGHPVHNPDGRTGTLRASMAAGSRGMSTPGNCPIFRQKFAQARHDHGAGIFARHRQRPLADDARLYVCLAKKQARRLFDELGLAFFDDQNGLFALREAGEFVRHERISHVQDVQRNLGFPEHVGHTQAFECAQHGIVQAPLQHDADVAGVVLPQKFIELALLDELDRGGPAMLDLCALLRIGRRRQNDSVEGCGRDCSSPAAE